MFVLKRGHFVSYWRSRSIDCFFGEYRSFDGVEVFKKSISNNLLSVLFKVLWLIVKTAVLPAIPLSATTILPLPLSWNLPLVEEGKILGFASRPWQKFFSPRAETSLGERGVGGDRGRWGKIAVCCLNRNCTKNPNKFNHRKVLGFVYPRAASKTVLFFWLIHLSIL